MFCPECSTEYREGFWRCSDCDVDLVFVLRPSKPTASDPDIQLVPIYASSNPALVPLVESILDEADIVFMKKPDGMQDLGRFFGTNQVVGPVEFWVREDEANEARELLRDIDNEIDESGRAGFLLPSAP